MSTETDPVVMRERVALSRPSSLGTPRRKPKGAARSGEAGAPSLDTSKQLATTVRNWLQDQETEWDTYNRKLNLWRQLLATVHQIWQDKASLPRDGAEQSWWDAYEGEREGIRRDENPAYDAWLEAYVEKNGLPTCPEAYLQCLYLTAWKKKHKPVGKCAEILKWEKQYLQLLHCQTEWIGYRPDCEHGSELYAQPVGCNHRLCPLCNGDRSRKAQRRMKNMFDRLEHPQFLTLTVPTRKRISKRTFHLLRKRVLQFLKMHPEMFRGGVYAIETTYRRQEKRWHTHAHVLVDGTFALPGKDQRLEFAGRNMPAFTLIKLALEFDWTRLWCKTLGKMPRKNAARAKLDGERWTFERWASEAADYALKEYDFREKKWVPITGLSDAEMRARQDWNRRNRRVLWIKPVDDRAKAAREVLKYITKSADFCDLPEAVEEFWNATRGARLIQTFGTWYGVDVALLSNGMDERDWKDLSCTTCGKRYVRMPGAFYKRDVTMDAHGRWLLRRGFNPNTAGTVPRPTIRALDWRADPEEFSHGIRIRRGDEGAEGAGVYHVR